MSGRNPHERDDPHGAARGRVGAFLTDHPFWKDMAHSVVSGLIIAYVVSGIATTLTVAAQGDEGEPLRWSEALLVAALFAFLGLALGAGVTAVYLLLDGRYNPVAGDAYFWIVSSAPVLLFIGDLYILLALVRQIGDIGDWVVWAVAAFSPAAFLAMILWSPGTMKMYDPPLRYSSARHPQWVRACWLFLAPQVVVMSLIGVMLCGAGIGAVFFRINN